MEKQILNFGDHNIPNSYETILGPFLFEPFAQDLKDRIDLTNTKDILELACGSGRLTRYIAESAPQSVNFTASDLSEEMIALAKTKVLSARVNWATINMLDIPFEDNSFDLVICQFGLMLVPDHQKAFSEILRVLKKGGKLVFSVWADLSDNQVWSVANDTLKEYLGSYPMQTIPGPFSMSDEKIVLQDLADTGFCACISTDVTNLAEISSAAMAAQGLIHGLPVFSLIQQQVPHLLPVIMTTLTRNLSMKLGDLPMRSSQRAWVFEAEK